MASRVLSPALRRSVFSAPSPAFRNLHTTPRRLTDAAALPVRKPVGALRGGVFGFLLGSTAAGAGVYYYILEEYRVSNELLTEDIYNLQASVQRVHTYVQTLEEQLVELKKKK